MSTVTINSVTYSDPQDELLIDDQPSASLTAILPPCYAYQANGYHFKNVETMRHRFYRAAMTWVSTGKAVATPKHFLCQHCMCRHSLSLDDVNSFVFDLPFSFRKGASYDHWVNGIIMGNPAAGLPDYSYNSFDSKTDVEFWSIVGQDAPDNSRASEKTAAKNTIKTGAAKSTSIKSPTHLGE